MRDASMRLDFRPPNAAMADANAIDIERLGNDDVIHARAGEPAALGEIGDAAITAGFFVDGSRDLDRAGELHAAVEQRFHRDHGGRKPAFHVAGTAPINLSVLHQTGEGIDGPAGASLHDVEMTVEVHARALALTFAPTNNVDARIFLAVARRSLCTHISDFEAAALEPLTEIFCTRTVSLPWRVDRRKPDKIDREPNKLVPPVFDRAKKLAGLRSAERSIHSRSCLQMQRPPSTSSATPVIMDASSL